MAGKAGKEAAAASKKAAAPVTNAAYASPATPTPPDEPVGPGAHKAGDYKNPEYYCYNPTSYFDLEVEMVRERCPQPVAENQFMWRWDLGW